MGATIFVLLKDQADIRELKRQFAEGLQGHYHADGTFHHGPRDKDESSADVSRDDVIPKEPVKQVDGNIRGRIFDVC